MCCSGSTRRITSSCGDAQRHVLADGTTDTNARTVVGVVLAHCSSARNNCIWPPRSNTWSTPIGSPPTRNCTCTIVRAAHLRESGWRCQRPEAVDNRIASSTLNGCCRRIAMPRQHPQSTIDHIASVDQDGECWSSSSCHHTPEEKGRGCSACRPRAAIVLK